MPWMLPLGLVSGVFMSPCASNQTSPSFCSLLPQVAREPRDRPHRDRVVAAQHDGQRRRPPRPRRRGRAAAAGLEDLLQVLQAEGRRDLRLLDRDREVARSRRPRSRAPRRAPRGGPRRGAPTGPCPRRGVRRRGRAGRRSTSRGGSPSRDPTANVVSTLTRRAAARLTLLGAAPIILAGSGP